MGKSIRPYSISGVISCLLFLFVAKDLPFFWDSIQLGARQADYIYQAGSFLLPDELDSGHPPGFGAYLSLWWSAFGRSLWVSHLAMLPWVWLLLFQLYRLSTDHLGKYGVWIFALVLLEPVLLGQILLISPDVVLIAAYLLGLNQVCKGPYKNSFLLLLAAAVLALVSTRGWIAAMSLYLLEWLHIVLLYKFLPAGEPAEGEEKPPSVGAVAILMAFQSIAPFLLGGVIGLSYLIFHYKAKGWISYHPDSPWAESFQTIGIGGFIRNIGLVGWRMIDLGRIGLWLALAIATYHHGWKRLLSNQSWQRLLLGILFFMLLLLPLALLHTGLTAPRYFLPAILLFDFFVAYTILDPHLLDEEAAQNEASPQDQFRPPSKWQKYLFAFCMLCLFSGNFWVYPQRIAQAWDATPAHLPFYQQEAAAIDFLQKQGIPLDAVGTVFPSIGPRDWRWLNGQQTGFSPYQPEQQTHFFVSLVHNDWTDSQLDSLASYPIVWQQKHWNGLWSILYQKPN